MTEKGARNDTKEVLAMTKVLGITSPHAERSEVSALLVMLSAAKCPHFLSY